MATSELLENASAGDASVLVTAKLARALPAACCGAYATKERSPWVLFVRVLQTKSDADLTQLEWRCRHSATASKQWHTQWFDAHDLCCVKKAADANAVLGRGLHEQPFEVENENRVELWTSPALGRFTLAKQHIAAGQCALKATAFAVVVKQQLARKRCHWCFGVITKKAFQCSDCKFALYCSRDCLDADEVLHGFQCRTLGQLADDNSSSSNRVEMAQLKASWETVGIDTETLRLTLAVLSMENFVRTTTPLARLVTNSSSARKNKQTLAQVASFLVAGITSANNSQSDYLAQVATLSHVRQTLERVQSNAHPLCLDGMTTVGVGVFPEAAMALNHSCLPNIVPSFDTTTRTLAFHAIRDIAPGHAVEYTYIDLFQATARRQEALADGFGFACSCWRCANEPQARPLSPKEEEEELGVMRQLLQLHSSDQLHRNHHSEQQQQPQSLLAEELFRRHRGVLERSPEMLFAYHMLQMKHAASERRWPRVISAAETLMDMWSALALPQVYPTMEVLHLQVQIAAEQVGNTARAALAKARILEIRRICGYDRYTEG